MIKLGWHSFSQNWKVRFDYFYLSTLSCVVNDPDELLDLADGGPSEVLDGDEGPLELRKCVIGRKLVRGKRHQVVDALRDQEPELEQEEADFKTGL